MFFTSILFQINEGRRFRIKLIKDSGIPSIPLISAGNGAAGVGEKSRLCTHRGGIPFEIGR